MSEHCSFCDAPHTYAATVDEVTTRYCLEHLPGTCHQAEKVPFVAEGEMKAFLKEIAWVCREAGFKIKGCGCCDSPWIEDEDGKRFSFSQGEAL